MKIALILPGTIWYAPYVRNYTHILNENHVEHDIISWNRDGQDVKEGIQYEENIHVNNGSAGFFAYLRYVDFIKKTIRKNKYDKLIVFGPQMTCLLSLYLIREYCGRFIIDYRDLSIEQKPGLRQLFAYMIKQSYANVISSPGFKRCLPQRNYYVSHNFNAVAVKSAIGTRDLNGFGSMNNIDVLTIGGIRDFSSNVQVVQALANRDDFLIRFVGRGGGAAQLASYCSEHQIKNVSFIGFYQKPEEAGYVQSSTFMNIFYPRVITHDTAVSNRFYNSLIYRKPMIVTKDTTQGDFAEKYNVGVALHNCHNLADELKSFMQQDYNAYAERCDKLLLEFLEDQARFEEMVREFTKS
ncbi:MAG: capsular biosynthesis protein [Bacteroidaceae bacterium]|nr:capsular biosynthesis protein [Bacteroidaceae bacterium]